MSFLIALGRKMSIMFKTQIGMYAVATVFLVLCLTVRAACPGGHIPTDRLTEVISNNEAFSVSDGEQGVRTFGSPLHGGALSTRQRRYTDVLQVVASDTGFALLHRNRTVTVLGQLTGTQARNLGNVELVRANDCAFTALHFNRSITSWGDSTCGGNAASVSGVSRLLATRRSFAVLTGPGSYQIWGSANATGLAPRLPMRAVHATAGAFVIETPDGSTMAVSDNSTCPVLLCNVSTLASELRPLTCAMQQTYYCATKHTFPPTDVVSTASTSTATAVVSSDHRVFIWGSQPFGELPANISNVRSVVATLGAFAALLTTGDVVVWGDPDSGGLLPRYMLPHQVHLLLATDGLFGALASDGRLFVWGAGLRDGVQHLNITSISASSNAILALRSDEQLLVLGSFLFDNELNLKSTCVACPENSHALEGALSCSACGVSRWSTAGSNECKPCTFAICDDQLVVMLLAGIVPFTVCACTFCNCRKTEAELLLEV